MATPRFAWGIDIGNRALKAVKLVRDGDTLRVDDFEFIEHETLLSQAGDNKESLIQSALANFVQRHTFKGGVVSIGVSGQSSFARFVKLPPIEEKKIPEIVRFEAIQQIPFPLDDVEWSYQLFREEDNPEIEVGIFAMRRDLVNQHIAYFTDFDLNVQSVQMNPLAVYNALAFDGRFNDGLAMVVDVGTDNTDLLIASNQSIWMRSIPIGGNNFTEALTKAFKLNQVKAEDLKKNAATSKYARQIFQHMRPVFADLVTDIQRSIGFYASSHRDAKITKVYVLGGTFKLPGLQKYLQQNLQMPVERIDSLSAGAPEDSKHAASFGDNLLSIVSAYGLAIQAMGGATVNSSLLPAAIQRERLWQDKTKWFGLTAALFVAGVTVCGARLFYENLQFKSGEGTKQSNNTILQRANTLSTSWGTIQGAGEAERTTIGNLATINQGKGLWPDILSEIVNAIPKPPADLAKAIEARDVDAIKKTPRTDRKLLQINEIASVYDPALVPKLTAAPTYVPPFAPSLPTDALSLLGAQNAGPSAATPPDPSAPAAAADPTGKGRGFVVTLRVTCPLKEAVDYVEQNLLKSLESLQPNAQRPTMRFAVRKARIAQSIHISQDPARISKMSADYNTIAAAKAANPAGPGSGGVPPGGPPPMPGTMPPGIPGVPTPAPGAPTLNPAEEAQKDRVTGESMVDDWEFIIVLCVELEPAPYTPPAPDPNAPAAPVAAGNTP